MKKLLQSIGNMFNLKVLTNDEYTQLEKAKTATEPQQITEPTTLLDYSKIVPMLTEYDTIKLNHDQKTGTVVGMKSLEYEDARISTFEFNNFKNYIAYIERLATEKNIEITGISFVKGSYNKTTASVKRFIGYESLIYIPTALIEGKETLVDLENSSNNNPVSFKSMLAKEGYEWTYDGDHISETDINNEKNNITKSQFSKSARSNSSAGNLSHLAPPKADKE